MASSDLNQLKIDIVADASTAVSELEKIGKKAIDVKGKLGELNAQTSETSKSFGELTGVIKELAKTNVKDPFGLVEVNKRLAELNSNSKALQKNTRETTSDLAKSIGKIETSLAGIQKHISDCSFKADKGFQDQLDRMADIIKQSEDQQKNRGKMLTAEERLLRRQQRHLAKRPFGVSNKSMSSVDRLNKTVRHYGEMGTGHFMASYAREGARIFYNEIAHLQEKRARVDAWGLNATEKSMWSYQVKDLLKNNKFITEADAESMMMAASSSIGHYDPNIVGKTVAKATKFAQMERAMGYNKSEIDDIAKNYYGVAEARQVANDVAKTLETFETVFKITTTTSGKITVADVETILRNMGPGASTISDEGLLRLLAYAEQIKIAGRGSSGSTGAGISTVGTNVKMLQLMAMGKPSSINAKRQMAELGVMEDGSYIVVNGEAKLAQDTSNKDNVKEQTLARGIFGQALEDVIVNGKKLGMAGVWNKELAQADPVKWVESMTDLIKQFTADKENRSEYYGKLAKGKENLDTREFLDSLSESQIYSATQTFWAKTGLSQRVLTALTTFSNEAFLHRSEAMMKTAMKQKSVDDLMQLQIENGNINLAFLRLQKATDNLIQSFEPLGRTVAKITFVFADFVESVTNWAREWNGLAQMTLATLAMWGGAKFAQHFGGALRSGANSNTNIVSLGSALGGKKEKRRLTNKELREQRKKGYKAPETQKTAVDQKTTGIFSVIQKIDSGTTKAISSVQSKMVSMIGMVGSAISKCFGGIGLALMAIDFATVVWGWLNEIESFRAVVKGFVNSLQDWIDKNPLVLEWRFGGSGSKEDNDRLNALEAELANKRKELNDLDSNDSTTGKDGAKIASLQNEITALRNQINDIKSGNVESFRKNKQDATGLQNVINKADLASALKELRENEEALGKQYSIVDLFNKQAAKGEKVNVNDYKTVVATAEAIEKARNESLNKVTEILRSADMTLADEKASQALRDSKSEAVARSIAESIAGAFKDAFEKAGYSGELFSTDYLMNLWKHKDIKDLSLRPVAGQFVSTIPQNSTAISKAKKNIAGIENTTQDVIGSGKKPDVYKRKKSDKLYNYGMGLEDRINKLSAPSVLRGDYETMEETRKRMAEEFLSKLASGQFKRKNGDNPFQKNLVDDGTPLSREDFDLSKIDSETGKTGYQYVEEMAIAEQLKNLGENIRNVLKSAKTAVITTNYELEEAVDSITEIGESSQQSTAFRNLKRDIEKLKKEINASPVSSRMRKQLDEVMSLRGDQALNVARKDAYGAMKSYDRGMVGFYENSLTSRGQQYAAFNRETGNLNAQHQARIQELEEAKKLAVIGKSLEEKQRIVEEANAEIEALNMRHHEFMLAREEDFNRKMNEKAKSALDDKIEAWQDVDAHIANFQSELMEGFVKANEDWLDGDLNSWRDYANNLLKILRNMFLKIGYSELLGGAAEGISGFLKDFTISAFGLENKGGDPSSLGSKAGNGLIGWIHGLTGGPKTQLPMTPENIQQLQPNMNGFGLNVQNGQAGYNMLSPATAGMSNAVGSGIAGQIGSNVGSEVADGLGEVTNTALQFNDTLLGGVENLGMVNTSLPLLNTSTLALNTTQGVSQTIETAGQAISQLTTSNQTQEAVATEAVATTAGQAAVALTEFMIALKSQQIANMVPHANGGIMTSKGPLPLKTYANGGIARTAQVAIFGEGRQPEAYVPLPDGRTIPVTINGGMGESGSVGGNNINISINVSNHNEGGSSENSSSEGDSSQQATNMKKLANNIKTMVKQELYNQSRPGGLLYNSR